MSDSKKVEISSIELEGEVFFKISNNDLMRPFFMSIVSNSNHWMFISSNGSLTAGRKNAEYALFPYYTDDKITEASEITGSKTIIHAESEDSKSRLWEPFSERQAGIYAISRNLYKNTIGNKVVFEEINHDLNLTFQYQWCSGDKFGFIRKCKLINNGNDNTSIQLLDGIQNIIPYGVGSFLQNASSNLVDAYKRNQLETEVGLGIYALSAIIVDKAEPSEALKANVVWSHGLKDAKYLVSSVQLDNFRKHKHVTQEVDVKAEKGAYFVKTSFDLKANDLKEWQVIADVNKSHSAVAELMNTIQSSDDLAQKLQSDIELGSKNLVNLNAGADGLQLSADSFRDTRHFANTLFNIMRGGIFDHHYNVEKWDLIQYLSKANRESFAKHKSALDQLPSEFTHSTLVAFANEIDDPILQRLCIEYMPLKFSRRHGDPSRPWNKFSINTRNEIDGSKILDYEGNWRDIFQNWEALAFSYPEFVTSMIHKFLNASTFDGYNPYRVTKSGFDWESIEPDDPWSYIGYWGDHQIIYLLKLLELSEAHYPGVLEEYFDKDLFVYANVPYRIKSHEEILNNSKDTIDFDFQLDDDIRKRREELGADGALLFDHNNNLYQVNFIEKILASVLAKISNFIPEGGIWMNTQRPEWNDANNALVGNGVSMVTLYYLRRFLKFFDGLISNSTIDEVEISEEVFVLFKQITSILSDNAELLDQAISDQDRKIILDQLGNAGSVFRNRIYAESFSDQRKKIVRQDLFEFIEITTRFLEHTIQANKRPDNLYHAYNLMTQSSKETISISYLSEMLEGQVAVLSSGKLSPQESLDVLHALKASKLFRPDQYSYILYPYKALPRFVEKNIIPKEHISRSKLLSQMIAKDDKRVIEEDVFGKFHFNGNFKNANDLKTALVKITDSELTALIKDETDYLLQIFEEIFDHKSFTGRSGTFYGYEGLGSIYWHMVSKLLLAVQESCLKAFDENASEELVGKLLEHYYEINEGIGVHKPPALYGAFPTDPYSHTPGGKGAQQPGMTGQVKEDVIVRFRELGAFVSQGKLNFNPCLLRKSEFIKVPKVFYYKDIAGKQREIQMPVGSLCYTYCQTPILYKIHESESLEVIYSDGQTTKSETLTLDPETSKKLFQRTGQINQITVHIPESKLR